MYKRLTRSRIRVEVASPAYVVLWIIIHKRVRRVYIVNRVASAQFPEALNSSTSPETPRTSGLDQSQFRKHVGISDLMGVNSGNTSDFRTWWKSIPKTRRNFGFDCSQVTPIKSENTSEFRNSGCKKSKFRIISFLRLFSRSTKLFRP